MFSTAKNRFPDREAEPLSPIEKWRFLSQYFTEHVNDQHIQQIRQIADAYIVKRGQEKEFLKQMISILGPALLSEEKRTQKLSENTRNQVRSTIEKKVESHKPTPSEIAMIDSLKFIQQFWSNKIDLKIKISGMECGAIRIGKNSEIYFVPSKNVVIWPESKHYEVADKVLSHFVDEEIEVKPLDTEEKFAKRVMQNKITHSDEGYVERHYVREMVNGDWARCDTHKGMYELFNIRNTVMARGVYYALCMVRTPLSEGGKVFAGAVTMPLQKKWPLIIIDQEIVRNDFKNCEKQKHLLVSGSIEKLRFKEGPRKKAEAETHSTNSFFGRLLGK